LLSYELTQQTSLKMQMKVSISVLGL